MRFINTTTGSRNMVESLRLMMRILTFRATREELMEVNHRDLTVGLLVTWIVGIGRYWDNDRVEIMQKMGVGSVIYVFVLALFLFMFLWAMRPKDLTYFRMLVFITMTSLPAIIYAIPVQMMFPEPGLETANEINLAFLALVATWRVALLFWFSMRLGKLDAGDTFLAVTVPITVLVFTLSAMNMEKVVFGFMGGIEPEHISANDDAFMALWFITMISGVVAGPALLIYIILVAVKWSRPVAESRLELPDTNESSPATGGEIDS